MAISILEMGTMTKIELMRSQHNDMEKNWSVANEYNLRKNIKHTLNVITMFQENFRA